MPGVTKHIYDHEKRDIILMWNNQLKSIQKCLPKSYREEDIVFLLKKHYPHEWSSVENKYWYYERKDKYLIKHFNKARYCMLKPHKLLQSTQIYRNIMRPIYRNNYVLSFSQGEMINENEKLWKKRAPKIEKINKKIEMAKQKTQQVTPAYLDQLIGLYERKNTSQKDKMYIIIELEKYYSFEIIQFFFKLNDTELNKQLRWIAFKHLQSFNFQPRARRQKYMQVHTKNKKRKQYLKEVYPYEKYNIPKNPDELEYRIENSKEQKIKKFDFFISHSSRDSSDVQKLIIYENKQGKNIFCDWINDSDYLKRNLVCKATLNVLEKRLEQSEAMIFVDSRNSKESVWCNYELNYFYELGKPIYTINKQDIEKDVYVLELLDSKWFIDKNYKMIELLKK
ncbi:UNVERIFIED_ORG: hypothetical protein B2H93_09180 [Clostridium botulinum]